MSEASGKDTVKGELSPTQVLRALRLFLWSGGLWGAWVQAAGISTAIFTGYALWLGASASDIALLTSIASVTSSIQLFAFLVFRRTEHKKRLVFLLGCGEMFFRFAVIGIPLLVPVPLRMPAMMVFVGVGLVSGYMLSPLFNTWLATTIPEEIRARFIGKRTIVRTIVSIVIGYLIGRFVDLFPEPDRYTAFLYVFLFGLIAGIGGYLAVLRAPLPRMEDTSSGVLRSLAVPFRSRAFRRALLFYVAWNFAFGIASPFYSVFMIKTLELNYALIAIFNNLFMLVMIVSYRLWGMLVDRYGSRPVLQIVMPPLMLVPILWVFNRPDQYVLIPVAMVISGFLQGAIFLAINSLLYSLLPDKGDKSIFFAAWSSSVNMVYSVAPLLGAFLVRRLEGVSFEVLGFPIGNLQIVFLARAALTLLPVILLRWVVEERAATPGHMLARVGRGNPFSFVYNFFLFTLSAEERRRAQAVRGMGRSRSPLAVERLVEALDDLSPHVRSQAAQGLGDTRSHEAVGPLIEELENTESDIRAEAAEALGKIGHSSGVDPLFEALRDPDGRVRLSAIRALGEIGGEEVQELLFWMMCEDFDRITFPAIVEALSGMGDLRIVRPTLQRLDQYRSPVIRSQLLNSICRVLGAGNRFYRILLSDELGRVRQVNGLLRDLRRTIAGADKLDDSVKEGLRHVVHRLIEVFEQGAYEEILERTREALEVVPASNVTPGNLERFRAARIAIEITPQSEEDENLSTQEWVFVLICLGQLVKTI